MNYEKHYFALIDRARNRKLDCYTEKHHAVPRCAGGTDDAYNLVNLTAEEHFLAHQLLLKMFTGTEYEHKMALAAHVMASHSNGKRSNNKLFGWLRRRAATAASITNKGFGKGVPKPHLMKPVRTPLGDFESLTSAAKAMQVTKTCIRLRLVSGKQGYAYL